MIIKKYYNKRFKESQLLFNDFVSMSKCYQQIQECLARQGSNGFVTIFTPKKEGKEIKIISKNDSIRSREQVIDFLSKIAPQLNFILKEVKTELKQTDNQIEFVMVKEFEDII